MLADLYDPKIPLKDVVSQANMVQRNSQDTIETLSPSQVLNRPSLNGISHGDYLRGLV
jgi:hypothetical protein